jgi:hypothetical protein
MANKAESQGVECCEEGAGLEQLAGGLAVRLAGQKGGWLGGGLGDWLTTESSDNGNKGSDGETVGVLGVAVARAL